MATKRKKRPYRKRLRAESEEETRRRITEAAVELHGTVGPANTTITELAERAGVSRMTVYNHFPTDAELFQACSGHWESQNPFPDPEAWTEPDPAARLGGALRELYGWYEQKQGMLGNVLRDARVLPSLATFMSEYWDGYMDALVAALATGWPAAGSTDREELRAALRLAVDFHTWRTLADAGLGPPAAAELTARMVSGAVRAR